MRLMKRVPPEEIHIDEEKKEFYYYKFRDNKYGCNRTKVTFWFFIFEEPLKEQGITWEDIKNKRVLIEEYSKRDLGFGIKGNKSTRFIKI